MNKIDTGKQQVMNMVSVENRNVDRKSIRKMCIKWLSSIILRISSIDIKNLYRNLEKQKVKIEKLNSHLILNETCINNELLPNYTHIYIYI